MPTPKQLLLEHRYDGDLAGDVKTLAANGMTWREIAELISARCGHVVSYESLRNWYKPKPDQDTDTAVAS